MANSPSTPAWTDADLAASPHAAPDKARRVRAMFAAIARSYDLNNRLHSFGRDQAWRRAAVAAAAIRPGDTVLDIACGTGDLALLFTHAGAHVLGLDFTVPMLALATTKGAALPSSSTSPSPTPSRSLSARPGFPPESPAPPAPPTSPPPNLCPSAPPLIPVEVARGEARRTTCLCTPAPFFAAGDAQRLPVPDACAHALAIAFGIRNVTDPAAALREFHRALRPGGRLVILEFSTPTNPLVRAADALYRNHIMPVTASWVARDRSGAYRYLPRSVGTFLSRADMVHAITAAGFTDITTRPLTFGVAVIYRAVKPH